MFLVVFRYWYLCYRFAGLCTHYSVWFWKQSYLMLALSVSIPYKHDMQIPKVNQQTFYAFERLPSQISISYPWSCLHVPSTSLHSIYLHVCLLSYIFSRHFIFIINISILISSLSLIYWYLLNNKTTICLWVWFIHWYILTYLQDTLHDSSHLWRYEY